MKRSLVIIPIVILAFGLNFLPKIDTKVNSVKDATVYTVCSFQSDDKKCTFCHNDIIKHNVLHGPVVDDCESCHQSTGNKHPKAKSEGFTLAEKTPDLCYICHEQKNDKKNIHAPVEGGECNSCHSPHGAKYQYLLSEPTTALVCAECHDLDFKGKSNIHAPIELDGCQSCHDSHQSDHEYLLIEEKSKLCATCHDNISIEKQAKFMHAPFEDDCSNCHSPHNSKERFLLSSSTPDLCFNCHDDIGTKLKESKFIHKTANDEVACQSCHSPHASSNSKLLIKKQESLCFNCHNEEINTGSKIIENIKEKLQESKYKHAALEGGCSTCHDPHASDFTSLLIGSFPEGEYASASIESFDLCFNCHDPDLLEKEYSSTATNFRNGDQNLHYIHINGDKGRNCNICHDMHASKNKYLIKNRTKYGNWDMPMNFLLKENGASCRTGCHTELEYDRMNPFKYGDIADNDSTETDYVTETGDTITITNIVQDSLIVAREDTDMIIDSLQTETDTLIVLIVDPEDDPDIELIERDSLVVAREDIDLIIDSLQTETDTLIVVTVDPEDDPNLETPERDSLVVAREDIDLIIDSLQTETDTLIVLIFDPEDDPDIESIERDSLIVAREDTDMIIDSLQTETGILIVLIVDPEDDPDIESIERDSLIVAREDIDLIIDSFQTETDTLIVLIVEPEDDPDIESIERDSLIVAREDTDMIIDSLQTETDTLIVLIVDPEDDPDIELIERDSLVVAREDTDPVLDNIQSETDTLLIVTDQENQATNAIDAFNKIKPIRIYFKYAKTEIAKNADDKILNLLEFMDTYPDVLLEVGGHTDSKGTYTYNIDLSKKRAQAIKRYLSSKGVLPGRIVIKAFGESYPIDTNSTEKGRANNRRVEFKLKN